MSGTPSLEALESSLEAFRRELTLSAHIALVEPDVEVSRRVTGMLGRRGTTVHWFESGASFIEWLGAETIAVAIVNVDLDDAFDAVKKLWSKDPLAEFIALSGAPDAALAVRCMEQGAQDLFPVPIALEDVFLSRVLAATERWRRALIDHRIAQRFQGFAETLLRRDDVRHRGAFDRFATTLKQHKVALNQSKEIMLVAANAFAGERTKGFLESEGYTVVFFSAIKDALEAAPRIEPRLLLSDAELLDGTAFDLYKEMERLHPDIEFLVISSANAVDIAIEAMANGARDCVLKPHEGLEAIQQKVRRALSMQAKHIKHQKLIDELRKLSAELVTLDTQALKEGGSVMIKVDPGKSQATLNRFLADLDREEQARLRRGAASAPAH